MQQTGANCWINGRFMDVGEARVSVLDHGLLYGDGIFEGVRFYHARAFRLGEHLERLAKSARAIALELPYSLDGFRTAVESLIASCGLTDGYLRLVVTRGTGSLGLDPSSCRGATAFCVAAPLTLIDESRLDRGVSLLIASTRRLPPQGLDPRLKSLNYLNQVLARMEASLAGADEAIMLNTAGFVAEGTAENVFALTERGLLTPPVTDGALAGITRGLIIELSRTLEVPVQETSLTAYDLYTAEECFLTGTGAGLVPVREIDGRAMTHAPGPVFTRLRAAYQALVNTETKAGGTCREPA